MPDRYTYWLIDILTIIFPFLLSFDRKVAFYRHWRLLWPGLLITGLFFIGWDVLFTAKGVWSFSDRYITGFKILGLPAEEWFFFLAIPYACVFIYDCLLAYFPFRKKADNAWPVFWVLGTGLLVIGAIFWQKAYTCSSFTFCGVALLIVYFLRKKIVLFRADAFLVMYLISLVPFLIVNGFLTALPVVIYNNAENLGIRWYTIPFEDSFYGMLLMLGNVAIMEWLRGRKRLM
jgi:lycopene cyclase domain-containing protein